VFVTEENSMPIIDDVTAQMKDAMRAKDKLRLTALRGIRAAFIEALKADGSETLTDDQCIPILRRLGKQRKESISAYEAADREDLAAPERSELAVIDAFLPSLADEATTTEWVQAAIAESGAAGPQDMGKVMGALMRSHKGDVDGGMAKDVALKLLRG
jgi:uncharacterized protein YqeY